MQTLLLIAAGVISTAVSMTIPASSPKGPSSVDSPVVPVCSGTDVSFHWSVDVPPGGIVIAVTWLFEAAQPDDGSNVTLASLVNNRFYPGPRNSLVTFLPNAGLRLSNVTPEHSGRYFVIALIASGDGNGVTSFENGTSLFVSDTDPVIRDGQLRVTLDHNRTRDHVRQTWITGLYCGQFLSRGRPPVKATWTTPSGRRVRSVFDETTASFVLPLAEGVETGTYVCHLTMASSNTGCRADTNLSTEAEAQLHVDGRDVRLRTLEVQLSEIIDKQSKVMTPLNPSQQSNAVWNDATFKRSNSRLLGMKSDVVSDHGHQPGRGLDNGISLYINLNKHLPDGALLDLQTEVAAKNEQQDRVMVEIARKTEELERELDELMITDGQRNSQVEQVLATMKGESSRLGMVQTQMQVLEAIVHNISEQVQHDLTSLTGQLNDIKELHNKSAAPSVCKGNWTLFNENYYFSSRERINWSQAKARCEELESWLVEINSAPEDEFIFKLTNKDKTWMGLSDTEEEGTFVWAASEKILNESMYSNWDRDEPNDHGNNEDCVHILGDGKWNDAPCTNIYGFVCERNAVMLD